MLQKIQTQSVFTRMSTTGTASSSASDMSETEFEDDMSDFDEYAGRRSEDSYGKRSDTTVSTFEELRTPASNDFKGFNFELPEQEMSHRPKKLVGPTGPHLLRYSLEALQDSLEEHQDVPEWSPKVGSQRAGPAIRISLQAQSAVEETSSSSVPLELWEPLQVAGWMKTRGYERTLIESFRMNDISGAILKDLKYGDLQELGIKSFGLRQNLWNDIRNLRGSLSVPSTPAEECYSPVPPVAAERPVLEQRRSSPCSNPSSPQENGCKSPAAARRRARRALRPDDVISPAESASIVAIEQLLPKPHHCSKGENCSKWRRQQRQLARIAKEFPLELEQIGEANASSSDVHARPTSEAVSSMLPSVVASSDILGPSLPSLRLDEQVLRVVPPRDPQENVRQFINFQHLDSPQKESSPTDYELYSPPLSPPGCTQPPHTRLASLPFKLTIPSAPQPQGLLSADGDRTIVRQTRTPITAMHSRDQQFNSSISHYDPSAYYNGHDIYRLGSPASAMDVPVTAIPQGPIARDASQSVPPDMRYGDDEPISRSVSRTGDRQYFNQYDQQFSNQLFSPINQPIIRPSTTTPSTSYSAGISRSASTANRSQKSSRQPSFVMSPVQEHQRQQYLSPAGEATEQFTPTVAKPAPGPNDVNYEGWMKKRKTKMLRHEWHENHFRLKGTTLAMHRDSKALEALEYIDVDDYAVACSSLASNKKLNAAFKSLKLKSEKKEDVSAFSFQLVPSSDKEKGMFEKNGKTHHFAVKTRDERIDWMRELMLAKALKQKGEGCEINVNGQNYL